MLKLHKKRRIEKRKNIIPRREKRKNIFLWMDCLPILKKL
jgi:hypothetical protein